MYHVLMLNNGAKFDNYLTCGLYQAVAELMDGLNNGGHL